MTDLARKLALLRYPRLESFTVADEHELVMLVAFLENRHTRQWEIAARAPLHKAGEEWHGALARYLADAGCPLLSPATPYRREALLEYITWLVGAAGAAGYEDRAAALNAAAAAEVAAAAAAPTTAASSGGGSSGGGDAAPATSPAVGACIRELAALLHVSAEGRSEVSTLQAVHRALRQRVLPATAAAAAAAGDGSGGAAAGGHARHGGGGTAGGGRKRAGAEMRAATASRGAGGGGVDWADFPLGFSTGDATLDRAAVILRMLYVADLRELQDAVNDILVTVQEFTAQPKTDASLGVVGR